MTFQSATFLTRNHFGVFVFQYRLSKKLRLLHPQIQPLFRRSLYTRDKQEALKKAKLWSIVMDELTQKLLNDPESYGRAMALLKRYQQIEDLSWDRVERFLSELTDGEEAILELAIQSAHTL